MLNVATASTEELRQILRDDFEHPNQKQDIDFLFEVMGELAKRRDLADPHRKTDQQAWEEFLKYYAPKEFFEREDTDDEEHLLAILTPHYLTPSNHGKECLGNGEWPGYECQCDECAHYLTCFPVEGVL